MARKIAPPRAKRGIIISDLHVGHRLGICPPEWDPGGDTEKQRKARAIRGLLWQHLDNVIQKYHPFDFLILNGDAIDGKAPRQRGSETILPDRNDQVKAAAAVVTHVAATKNYVVYGTAYHTGQGEDWEEQVADQVNAADRGGHLWLAANGLVISAKHHIAVSQVPHGRHTALARDRLWEVLWAERGDYPKADLIIRSHAHYFIVAGGDGWTAIVTPAMQAWGVKYARQMSGMVDLGVIVLDIEDKYRWRYTPILMRGLGALRTHPAIV